MTAQGRVDFALRDPEIYRPGKIMVRKTADSIIACLDREGLCFDSLSYGIQAKAPGHNPKYLLGLLNSKFFKYVHAQLSQNEAKVFAKVLAENLRELPMPNLNLKIQKDRVKHDAIVALVDRITMMKQAGEDVTLLENEVDQLVYGLFHLTPNEIEIIENIENKTKQTNEAAKTSNVILN